MARRLPRQRWQVPCQPYIPHTNDLHKGWHRCGALPCTVLVRAATRDIFLTSTIGPYSTAAFPGIFVKHVAHFSIGCTLPHEWDRIGPHQYLRLLMTDLDIPVCNTSIHFGDSVDSDAGDVTFHFHRVNPFTRFQVWMIRWCFGWRVEQDR